MFSGVLRVFATAAPELPPLLLRELVVPVLPATAPVGELTGQKCDCVGFGAEVACSDLQSSDSVERDVTATVAPDVVARYELGPAGDLVVIGRDRGVAVVGIGEVDSLHHLRVVDQAQPSVVVVLDALLCTVDLPGPSLGWGERAGGGAGVAQLGTKTQEVPSFFRQHGGKFVEFPVVGPVGHDLVPFGGSGRHVFVRVQ